MKVYSIALGWKYFVYICLSGLFALNIKFNISLLLLFFFFFGLDDLVIIESEVLRSSLLLHYYLFLTADLLILA